jgi:hypothetical protein
MPTEVKIWKCDYCGDRFIDEEACQRHEIVCGYNHNSETTKLYDRQQLDLQKPIPLPTVIW